MAELDIYSQSSASSNHGDSDIKQLVLDNQARIEKIFSQITEHINSQKNVNSMLYKIVEGFQKDVAELRSLQPSGDTDSVKMNADDSSLAEQIADLKKRVSEDESSEAAKLMRMMQKIESFENRLKDDEMHDDALAKKLESAKSAITNALECKTTVLEKDIRRLSGNMLPLKSKLGSYETQLKSIMESEKLDVTELAKRFESLSSLVEDIANTFEGERSESSKIIESVKKNVFSIKNQLVKHQDKVSEQLKTDFTGKLKDLRSQLGSVQKSLPNIKTKLSMHEKKLSSLESGEKADVLEVTGRLDDIQKTLSSIFNELDREEKKTNERFKSLRSKISAAKAEIEGKIRVNVSDLDSRINIITKTIPAIQDELGMHDKELKDLTDCETLDIQKITGALSSFKIDLDRLGKKLDSGQKILVLDLRNRLSHMELSLSDTLKSQSRFVKKEIDTVAMHIPQLKSKLSVHENQFRKLMDSQRVSSQKFSENIEKLSSTIENEETISSSRIQSLKGRIESINTDLRKLHKDNFNVIDNEIKDSVSSLRSDIKELGANMPVIKSRLLRHDSDLANIMKRETFDVRLLAGRLENLASEIDEIDKKQEEYEINSAKSVMELRKNILLLLEDLKKEDLKKFSSIDESIKSSVSQVRKEIENVFSQIPSIRNELSEYITELRILSESKDSDTKQILDKFSELSSNLVLLSSRVKDDENEESERIGHLKSRVLEIRDDLQSREKKDLSVLGRDIKIRIDSVKKEMGTISDNVPELRNKISSISSALDTAVTSETYDVGELSGRLEDFHRELKHDEIKSYSQVDSLRKQIVSVKETLRIDMQEQAKTLSQRIDSFADELPEIKSALKSHAKDIRMLTEKESFDVKTLSGKLDGLASELAGFERLTHDSFLELRGHINDVNHDMISNLTRSISIVRTEINDVKNKVPELSKKISQIDKSLLDLSKTETTDISLAFEKFQSLSDSLDFTSEVFMKKTSDNSRKIKELKKHTESLNTSLELKVDSNRDTFTRVILSKVKMLSKDIDSVALSIIPFKDDFLLQKRRLENLSKTDKLDFRQLKAATKSIFNQIGSMEHRVLADEMTNSRCIDGMRGKIKDSRSALEKDIRLQALALKKSIGSVSEKIPSLRERIDNDRKDLDAMLKKEEISIRGLSSILSSVESELYEVDTESSKRVDNLKESISVMRKQLFKKHCKDMDHLEKNVSDKMSVIHNEIERVGDFIPGIRESISKNEYLLKQLRDKEKIDISQVLALTDNLNSDIDAVEARLSDQKSDYNSKLKNLKIKMGDIRSDMDGSLRLQAKSLQKEIDAVSSRFPPLKKELSLHSSRLKSIMSKEQIDFKDLNSDLNGVLGILNQTTSELHGEERKSKTHFEKLHSNILSMQDRLLHKQETADKELNDSLKEQGKRLGSDIDAVSSRFPLIKKELSVHSSRLKSIMSKEQIDFKDLNSDLNGVLGTLNQTTSELHGEERKSKTHFEKLHSNILSIQERLLHKQETADKELNDSLKEQGKRLGLDIDAVSSQFPSLKKELSVHTSRLKSIMSKEQIDFKDLNNDLNRVLGTLNQTTSELHGEERKSKTHFEILQHNIVSMQDRLLHKQETADKELNDSLKEQGKRLSSEIDSVSGQFPPLKEELSLHTSRLKSIMSKEQIDFKDLNSNLNSVLGTLNQTASELHGEERKSEAHFEKLHNNIVSMQERLLHKQETFDKRLQDSLRQQGKTLSAEIDSVSGQFPPLKKELSLHTSRLKSIMSKEQIDFKDLNSNLNGILGILNQTTSELHSEERKSEAHFKTLRHNISSMQDRLLHKQETFDKRLQDSLRQQGKILSAEIDSVSGQFPSLKKELSVHSSRLKSIMSKEQIDFKDLNNDLNRVLGTLNQTTSELHGEERKSKTHFETLQRNIVSMQDRLLHKQETADKELNDSLKEQGKRLGSDIDAVSSQFPSLRKELSAHSSGLKSIISKEQIDFKALNSDLNGVLGLLNQTTSEFHGEERKSKTHFELLKNNIKSMQISILKRQKEGDTHIASLLRNKTSETDSKINDIVLQTRKLKNDLKSDDSKIESMIKDIGDENADISLLFSRLGDMDSYFHSMADVSKKKIEELKILISKTKKEVIEDSLENTGNLEKRLGRNIASVMKSFDGLSGSVIKLKSKTLLDAEALKKLSGKEDIDIKKIFEKINKINTELSSQESTTLKDIDGLRSNIGSMKSYFDSALKANISDIRKNLGAVSKKIPALRNKFSVHEKQLKKIADSKAVDMKNVYERIDLLNSDISNIGKDFMKRNKISETSLSMLKSSISDLRKSMRHRNIDKITTYENLFKKNIDSVRSEIKAIEVTFPELSERLAKYERKLSDMSKNENVSRENLVEQIRNINDYIDSFIDKKTAKNEIKNVREKIKDVRSAISSSIDSDMVSVKDEIGSICESIGDLDHRLSEQDSNIGKIGGDVGSRVDSIAKKSDELSEGLYSRINEIESSLGGLKEEEGVSDDSLLNRIGVLEERLNNIEGNEVVKLFSDVPSGNEFYFLSYDYAPTGLVARNVVEFVHIFKTMDPNIIAFHMREGSNDFANWFLDVVGDAETSEMIRHIAVDYSDIETARNQLLEILYVVVPFSIN